MSLSHSSAYRAIILAFFTDPWSIIYRVLLVFLRDSPGQSCLLGKKGESDTSRQLTNSVLQTPFWKWRLKQATAMFQIGLTLVFLYLSISFRYLVFPRTQFYFIILSHLLLNLKIKDNAQCFILSSSMFTWKRDKNAS